MVIQNGKVIAYAYRQVKSHEINELNLRQGRWMELIKESNYIIDNHPRKGKCGSALAKLKTLADYDSIHNYLHGYTVTNLRIESHLSQVIIEAQKQNAKLSNIMKLV